MILYYKSSSNLSEGVEAVCGDLVQLEFRNEKHEDSIIYGNPEALDWLRGRIKLVEELDEKIKAGQRAHAEELNAQQRAHAEELDEKLKAGQRAHAEEIRKLRDQDEKLEAMVKALQPSAKKHDDIRKRFLEFYRRDVLKNITDEGYKKIQDGNMVAHHGAVIADREFYPSFQREEEETLTKIYGLDREHRESLGKSYIPFLIVSLHAYITFYRPW